MDREVEHADADIFERHVDVQACEADVYSARPSHWRTQSQGCGIAVTTERHKSLLPTQYSEFSEAEVSGDIVTRFKLVVARRPDHAALKYRAVVTTYAELDSQSDSLARLISGTYGLSRAPLALLYQQGTCCCVAQLAVLKSGNYFANIDSYLERHRQLLLLADLTPALLLHDHASTRSALELAESIPSLVLINTETLPLRPENDFLSNSSVESDDYACVVYTSGSTGAAQGVILTHRHVLHLARRSGLDMHLSHLDRSIQLCELWTGASISEIYCALLNEATLYPCSVKRDGIVYILNLVKNELITTFVAAPILFRALMKSAGKGDKFASVRLIRLGGDRVTRDDIALFNIHFVDSCLLRIGYGSSEMLLVSQFFVDQQYTVTDESGRIPVGHPVEGTEVDVLDLDGNKAAPNEPGEIAIRSRFLGPGYLKNDSLTRSRFRGETADGSGLRMYLTRDLGYKDSSGSLYLLGRNDSRVKIHGKFVLLTDVEQSLAKVTGIQQSVVIPLERDDQGTILAAFVVTTTDSLDERAIKKQLQNFLAPEVVPRLINIVEKLPMLNNSKVDRRQLHGMALATLEAQQK
jgi:acyl-coenzyme A synthetase/AMP-(fatty) acid ligase